jgi:ribosomal protein L12E/L44/L45/RPP1/RPP2
MSYVVSCVVLHVDHYLQQHSAPLDDATGARGTRIAKCASASRFHFFIKRLSDADEDEVATNTKACSSRADSSKAAASNENKAGSSNEKTVTSVLSIENGSKARSSTDKSASTEKSTLTERLERVEASLTFRELIARFAMRWHTLRCACEPDGQQVYEGLQQLEIRTHADAPPIRILPHIDLWYRERETDAASP